MAYTRNEIKELEPMVKSGEKRFVHYQEGAELYSMGLHTFEQIAKEAGAIYKICLLYTSPSPRDYAASRMPSSA